MKEGPKLKLYIVRHFEGNSSSGEGEVSKILARLIKIEFDSRPLDSDNFEKRAKTRKAKLKETDQRINNLIQAGKIYSHAELEKMAKNLASLNPADRETKIAEFREECKRRAGR